MNVIMFLIIGLIGSLLMFAGDMTLYYNRSDYVSDGSMKPIIDIMKRESRVRLYFGGIFGPIAAFLYCIGYYHIILITDEKYLIVAWCCFLTNCLGIICGGTYHSHCSYYGLIGRLEHESSMKEISKYLKVQNIISFGIQGIGFFLLIVLIITGWTDFPNWMFTLTPGILFLFTPAVRKLPKGFHIVICGGWTNLISVIYYIFALMFYL